MFNPVTDSKSYISNRYIPASPTSRHQNHLEGLLPTPLVSLSRDLGICIFNKFPIDASARIQGLIWDVTMLHPLNMRFLWTQLASIFPLSMRGRRALKFMGHFKAHLANLSCFSWSYTFYLLTKFSVWELEALIWEALITFLAQIENTLGLCSLLRCSADKGYLIGKVVKNWPSLWELGVIEMVLMDHCDPTKEDSVWLEREQG